MKLRNIFLASLAVCTMASCSKDDDINKGPVEPVDASVSFAASTGMLTKATDEGSADEKIVDELTALVFNSDGSKLVGSKSLTLAEFNALEGNANKTSIDRIEHILIKVSPKDGDLSLPSDDRFTIVLVANANNKVSNVTSLADLKKAERWTETIDAYNKKIFKTLPMVSKEISFTGVFPMNASADADHVENWVGADESSTTGSIGKNTPTKSIYLNRLVARVDLRGIQVDFTKYPGAEFRLAKIFIANTRSKSNFFTSGGTDTPNSSGMWKGYQSPFFEVVKGEVIPAETASGEVTADAIVKAELSKNVEVAYNDMKGTATEKENYPKQFAKRTEYFYLFNNPISENKIDNTRLILEGYFKRSATAEEEMRHFHVVLNDNGTKAVLPNTIYSIYVNITGEGSPNEDDILTNAHVAATIEVAPWNVIEQTEEDAN